MQAEREEQDAVLPELGGYRGVPVPLQAENIWKHLLYLYTPVRIDPWVLNLFLFPTEFEPVPPETHTKPNSGFQNTQEGLLRSCPEVQDQRTGPNAFPAPMD